MTYNYIRLLNICVQSLEEVISKLPETDEREEVCCHYQIIYIKHINSYLTSVREIYQY